MAISRPGSFSAFLEYSQRSTESGMAAPASSPTSLLTIIRKAPEAKVRMADLTERSKMTATEFHDALQ